MKFGIDNDAPMLLIPLSALKALGHIPSSEERALANVVSYENIVASGRRPTSLLVFLSHQWLSPSVDRDKSNPDYGTLKHTLLCQGLDRLVKSLQNLDEVLLWIDFCCIDQKNDSLRKIGLANLPGYLERCDVLFTPYTDQIYKARGESIVVPETAHTRFQDQSEFSLFGRYRSLFDYVERAWCRLEMFMATNAPMPDDGFGYFSKLGIKTREDRPHLFYGTWQAERGELPDPGPVISGSFVQKLRPEDGFLTFESDRTVIRRLVASINVKEITVGYQGEVNAAGLPEGQGVMHYESGAVYEGKWKAGKHHGQGTFIFANGMRYVGGWQNGKRSGYGIHYLSNGLIYKGSFFDGSSHGSGRLFHPNGQLKCEGIKDHEKWKGKYREFYANGVLRFDGEINGNEWSGTEYNEDGSILRTGKWNDPQ